MAKIAVDCDGVLAAFDEAFKDVANRMWPGRVREDYVNQHWNDLGGLDKDEQRQVWDRIKATPDWWLTVDAYTENVGAMAIFLHQHRGHDIWIVTSRAVTVGNTVAYQTYLWLRACGVDPVHNYLGVLPVDNWHDKKKIYKYAQIEYSVDDKTETVEDCDTLPDHKAFLLDRPWNQDAKVKRRVSNLTAFFGAIERKP